MIKIPVRRIQNVAQLAGIGCQQSQVHHSLSNSFLGRVVDVESFNQGVNNSWLGCTRIQILGFIFGTLGIFFGILELFLGFFFRFLGFFLYRISGLFSDFGTFFGTFLVLFWDFGTFFGTLRLFLGLFFGILANFPVALTLCLSLSIKISRWKTIKWRFNIFNINKQSIN